MSGQQITIGSKVRVMVKNAPKMIVIQTVDSTDGFKVHRCAWFNTKTEQFNYESFSEEVLEPVE